MVKNNKTRKASRQKSPVRLEKVGANNVPSQAMVDSAQSLGEHKRAHLLAWGQVLTPLATILTLVFAAYQARLAQNKEEMAVHTLNTAERASRLAMQSSRLIQQSKNDLEFITAKQQELEDLTQISVLTIRAENGDRNALAELFDLTPDALVSWLDHGPVSLAKKNLDRIAHKFNGMTIDDPVFLHQISGPSSMGATPESIASNLFHTNYITRAQAAFNASFLRVNKLIPVLYESAQTEQDLHVLSVICYSLNRLLDPDNKPFFTSQFVFHPEWASNTYTRLWYPAKDVLLAQSPKMWIRVEPKPDSPWNIILVDPDTHDERTGMPK